MTTTTKALLAAFLLTAAPATALHAQGQPAAKAPTLTPSKEAIPALQALKKAVDEKRTAEIVPLGQKALAVAKTNNDRYLAHRLQLPYFIESKNDAALLGALEGIIATGIPTGADLGNLTVNAARIAYNMNDNAKAATYANQAIAADPANGDSYIIRGEINNRAGRYAEAVADLRKGAELMRAAGKTVDPKIDRRALAIAYNNKLPVATDLAFGLLKTAPSAENWRNAIKIQAQLGNYAAGDKVDLYRLQRATGSLDGEGDFYPYVDGLMTRGFPGEAKAVLDEARAASALDFTKPMWKDLVASSATRTATDRASLAAGEKAALGPASAKVSLNTADALLGYGEYARAAAVYRAALKKPGVDMDAANLRLGIALARSGDKPGAIAALAQVKGPRAGIARLWTLYVQTKA